MVVLDERARTAEHTVRAPHQAAGVQVERARLHDRAEAPSRTSQVLRILVSGSAWVVLLLAVGAVVAIAFLVAGTFLPGA